MDYRVRWINSLYRGTVQVVRMIAYKLFKLRKNGTIGSLFINTRQVLPLNKWLPAEDHLTKGYAHRPGWHVTCTPVAPHLSMVGRVWGKVEVQDVTPFKRPTAQGSMWYIAKRMRIISIEREENGDIIK